MRALPRTKEADIVIGWDSLYLVCQLLVAMQEYAGKGNPEKSSRHMILFSVSANLFSVIVDTIEAFIISMLMPMGNGVNVKRNKTFSSFDQMHSVLEQIQIKIPYLYYRLP